MTLYLAILNIENNVTFQNFKEHSNSSNIDKIRKITNTWKLFFVSSSNFKVSSLIPSWLNIIDKVINGSLYKLLLWQLKVPHNIYEMIYNYWNIHGHSCP